MNNGHLRAHVLCGSMTDIVEISTECVHVKTQAGQSAGSRRGKSHTAPHGDLKSAKQTSCSEEKFTATKMARGLSFRFNMRRRRLANPRERIRTRRACSGRRNHRRKSRRKLSRLDRRPESKESERNADGKGTTGK